MGPTSAFVLPRCSGGTVLVGRSFHTSEQSLSQGSEIGKVEAQCLPILPPEMQHTDESAVTIRGPGCNDCVGVGHMSLILENVT